MRRFIPAGFVVIYAVVPFFPSFIALTGVAFPGLSLLPKPATLMLLAVCIVLAVYALALIVAGMAGASRIRSFAAISESSCSPVRPFATIAARTC